eukprot:m.51743 g.51743  ORF g.51743 m.51743 type:complete len:314 (+) comp11258_c0_seq2:1435-2376(+)
MRLFILRSHLPHPYRKEVMCHLTLCTRKRVSTRTCVIAPSGCLLKEQVQELQSSTERDNASLYLSPAPAPQSLEEELASAISQGSTQPHRRRQPVTPTKLFPQVGTGGGSQSAPCPLCRNRQQQRDQQPQKHLTTTDAKNAPGQNPTPTSSTAATAEVELGHELARLRTLAVNRRVYAEELEGSLAVKQMRIELLLQLLEQAESSVEWAAEQLTKLGALKHAQLLHNAAWLEQQQLQRAQQRKQQQEELLQAYQQTTEKLRLKQPHHAEPPPMPPMQSVDGMDYKQLMSEAQRIHRAKMARMQEIRSLLHAAQ